MRRRLGGWLCVVLLLCGVTGVEARPRRVLSLDQCADQYVLALADRDQIAAVSPRADDPDSEAAKRARGLRRVRPSLEAVAALRPDLVVRYWGGDGRLMATLRSRGIQVVEIADAQDFDGVRADTRAVAAALGQAARGDRLVEDMDRRLGRADGAWKGRPGFYLTSGGFTAGPGSLVSAMITAAGVANAIAVPAFAPARLEALVLRPPSLWIRGFFDQIRSDRRGAGRHPALEAATRGAVVIDLPARTLTCPAWFSAEATAMIARAAR